MDQSSTASSHMVSSSPACPTNYASDPPTAPSSPRNETAPTAHTSDVPTSSTGPTIVLGKRKPIRPGSEAWNHFTIVNGRAQCKYCPKSYACDSKTNGNSNLIKHIREKCPKFPGREQNQKTLFFQPKKCGDEGSRLTATTYDAGLLRKQVTSYIITEELPFLHVETDGFRDLMRLAEPRFTIPSRKTTTSDVLQLFKTEREKLKGVLVGAHQRVCLTTDTWTSNQNLNYMCLTAHYIDSDWRYQKRIINFRQVEDHKGETLGKQIKNCLIDWGIEKVTTVTVDNASANDLAIKHLGKRVNHWRGSELESRHIHMRCCAHILNLVVTYDLKDYNESIARIREVVKYRRGSPARLMKFKACITREKITSKALLCTDVGTRWNSTYLMLQAAEKFQAVFDRLAEEDGQFVRNFYRSSGSGSGESLTIK